MYSDKEKSPFTKYTNLHLGRAYEVMSPKDYWNKVLHRGEQNPVQPEEGQYVKDLLTVPEDETDEQREGRLSTKLARMGRMIDCGYDALYDAFCVLRNEHVFNIYNSNGNGCIEEFNPNNANYYSQAQCAIVIERVFSRLYKYLKFKSTTFETFQRHFNVDMGYKYLDPESILNSEANRDFYYHDSDAVKYIRYLDKLKTYTGDESDSDEVKNAKEEYLKNTIGLSNSEVEVLKNFVRILSLQVRRYILNDSQDWNLCPFCLRDRDASKVEPRSVAELEPEQEPETRTFRSSLMKGVSLSPLKSRAVDEDESVPSRTVTINFNLSSDMQMGSEDVEFEGIPFAHDELGLSQRGTPVQVSFSIPESDFPVDVQTLARVVKNRPRFTYGNGTDTQDIPFDLSGFSTSRSSTTVQFGMDSVIDIGTMGGNYSMVLYAMWKPTKYILKFNGGNDIAVSGSMPDQEVLPDQTFVVNQCQFHPAEMESVFTYFEPPAGAEWIKGVSQTAPFVYRYEFLNWEFRSGNGRLYRVGDGQQTVITSSGSVGNPVVEFTAKWEQAYGRITFLVDGQPYCDVMTNMELNQLVYPDANPSFVDPHRIFLGWSLPEGYYIPGIDEGTQIVCGDGLEPVLCRPTDTGYIVCVNHEKTDYGIQVSAYVGDTSLSQYEVQFKYMNESGEYKVAKEDVVENQTLVPFHIHQKVIKADGEYVFRYWKLVSGNITSSFTIMSNCVFDAVYDKVSSFPNGQQEEVPQVAQITMAIDWREYDKSLNDGCPYFDHTCTFYGQDPKDYWWNHEPEVCPYLKMMTRIWGDKEDDDFDPGTLLEIEDVSNLLKALFKINVHIAHEEYYLKTWIEDKTDWFYGYLISAEIVCQPNGAQDYIVCRGSPDDIVCQGSQWVSFEPTVEYKFSNFHAANQVVNGKLVCTVDNNLNESDNPSYRWLIPVNRELLADAHGDSLHFSDFWYYYDYQKTLMGIWQVESEESFKKLSYDLSGSQRYYSIYPLYIHENTAVQNPADVNGFVKRRFAEVQRTNKQVQTFTSVVKKYRPLTVPNVRDIFNDCQGQVYKHDAETNNDYGVFGWCTVPSKTMVDMQYNEQAIIVPSSYDCHNRVGGDNFLQLDNDPSVVYRIWNTGAAVSNVEETWCYLYAKRDWTYFMKPFFNVDRNNEIYTYMMDTFPEGHRPANSDHINGILFEPSILGRDVDTTFGDMVRTCQYLAEHHHGKNALITLSQRYTNMFSFSRLKELTANGDDFNAVYGSVCNELKPQTFRFPDRDWIDDYDKTGSYLYKEDDQFTYTYNIGQAHAIDDFDEDSVWFYITMVEPLEEQEDVIEVEDIMPFVFWWENRGKDNNGPDVNCYGKDSNAKLNYEKGGWCYSSAQQRVEDVVSIGTNGHAIHSDGEVISEQRWHAVQHTLGTDFSKPEYGGTVLSTDNSGNVFKGAFDPNCAGTDEKWKIHNVGNAFGADQSLDPKEDKYWKGEETHGGGTFNVKVKPTTLNEPILESIQDRPMTWNLWNVVRHYVYIKWFKNKYRTLGNDAAMWNELEQRTQKLVKGIYRTYQQTKNKYDDAQFNFGTIDESSNNVGNACLIRWTNSFVQISSILERNAREHEASFVLFTGNNDSSDSIRDVVKQNYESIRNHQDNFVVTTLDGIDSDELGMRPDDGQADTAEHHVYHGHTNADLPISYLIGENTTYRQNLGDVDISIPGTLSIDDEYPFCEYYKDDTTKKWVRNIRQVVMNRQILPVYTNMETMKLGVHDVTTEDLKKITFQVIPQFYWKYNWSYNEFMIHPVGKLEAPSGVIPMYDMLGNVWEWVRDDWTEKVSTSFDGKINPIATGSDHSKKVIRGGAFDQLVRKVISPSREGLTWNQFKSKFGTQANVGFRPAMVYTEETGVSGGGSGTFTPGETPVDLFFLFDASSTQDNQITEMVASAREIVKMFAQHVDSTDKIPQVRYTSNQGCFVGSALFLGPQIRLMCSNLLGSATLKQFVTKPRVEPDGMQWRGWGTDSKSKADSENSDYNRARNNSENDPNHVLDDLESPVQYSKWRDASDFFGNVTRQSPRLADMTKKFKTKWKNQKNAYLKACDDE